MSQLLCPISEHPNSFRKPCPGQPLQFPQLWYTLGMEAHSRKALSSRVPSRQVPTKGGQISPPHPEA